MTVGITSYVKRPARKERVGSNPTLPTMHRYDDMLILAGVEKVTHLDKLRKLAKRRIRNPIIRTLWLILAFSGAIYTLRDEYWE